MYSRQTDSDRYRGVRLPSNYSGNAFRRSLETENEISMAEPQMSETVESTEAINDSRDGKDVLSVEVQRPARLDRRGGIGFEELLIIGIVVLISLNNEKDDLSYLLLLLLFLG